MNVVEAMVQDTTLAPFRRICMQTFQELGTSSVVMVGRGQILILFSEMHLEVLRIKKCLKEIAQIYHHL